MFTSIRNVVVLRWASIVLRWPPHGKAVARPGALKVQAHAVCDEDKHDMPNAKVFRCLGNCNAYVIIPKLVLILIARTILVCDFV